MLKEKSSAGKKIRVLVVSTTFPRWEGDSGPAPFVFDLAKNLVSSFEVIVLAPHYPGASVHEAWNGMEIFRFRYLPENWEFLGDGQGLQNHFRKSLKAKIALVAFFIGEFIAGVRLLSRRRVDAVNSHWLVPSGLIFAILSRIWGLRHISTVHSADYFLLSRIPLGKFLIRMIVNWSEAIISVNSRMAEEIKRLSKDARVLVMPMGFEPDKFQKIDNDEVKKLKRELGREDERFILFVGKLSEKKGIHHLISAMKLLEKEFPWLKLLIIGEGGLRTKLEEQAENLGLAGRIKFLGAIPHQRIALYYHLAELVVVPSIPDKYGETEGMPVVVLEALASNKPVVGTIFCSAPEELKRSGGFIELGEVNPQAIARAIIKVINQRGEMDFSRVNQYSWEQVSGFYAEVISGG